MRIKCIRQEEGERERERGVVVRKGRKGEDTGCSEKREKRCSL